MIKSNGDEGSTRKLASKEILVTTLVLDSLQKHTFKTRDLDEVDSVHSPSRPLQIGIGPPTTIKLSLGLFPDIPLV